MNDKPLLSLVTSVYNSGSRLREFLTCISNQTYSNIEVIIIDDCSTDLETLSILKDLCENKFSFTKKFTFIRNSRNLGLLKSFQKGLNKAHGEFIAFPESDDYIDDNFYEIGIDYLIKYKADVVKGLMLYKYLTNATEEDNIPQLFDLNLDYTTSWYYIFNRSLLTKNCKKPSFLNAVLYAACRNLYYEYTECKVPLEKNSYYICYCENKEHKNLSKEWKYFVKQIKKEIVKYLNVC